MIHLLSLASELEPYEKTPKGFVPTMGNLHLGHLSLMEQSLKDFDLTVVSIFVNPRQFGPEEDFERYPRTLEADLKLIDSLHHQGKKILVFAPQNTREMYPKDLKLSPVPLHHLDEILCAKSRPGHFRGVVEVVQRLFQLVQPTQSYFGEKDYQQVKVIEHMIRALRLSTKIKSLPIVRDQDGLALSSRNNYLSPKGRTQALTLPRTLKKLAQSDNIKREIETILSSDSAWEYLELRDPHNLEPAQEGLAAILLGAYRVGKTRLIDNQWLQGKK